MKIKRVDVINLYGYLKTIENAQRDEKGHAPYHYRFVNAAIKNTDLLETDMKTIRKTEEMLKGYTEKIKPIQTKYGKVEGNRISIPMDKVEAFQAEIKAVEESEEFKSVLAEWKKFTEEEIDFTPYMFDLDVLPKEITGAEIRLMKPLIKE